MSKREAAIEWLKKHPNEDITTAGVAEEMGWTRTEATQTLHGLVRYGMGGSLRRTGQSTWIYQPPRTGKVARTDDTATDIPVGFKGEVQVTGKYKTPGGEVSYLLAVLRSGKDTGLRLMAHPYVEVEFTAPTGGEYEILDETSQPSELGE
jgi:hypothetical protein